MRQNIREFGFQEQERRIICRQSELVRLECYYSLTLIFHLSTLSKYSKKNLKPGDQLSRQENANQRNMFTQDHELYHPTIDAVRAPTVKFGEVLYGPQK